MSTKINFLGIDPGLKNSGWAVASYDGKWWGDEVQAGHILTEASDKKRKVKQSDDNTRRTRELIMTMREVFDHFRPAVICVESMSYPPSSKASHMLGIAWGVISTLALGFGDIPIVQASPQEIKQAVCKKKDASKAEVRNALDESYTLIGLEGLAKGKLEHPYDALGAIVACRDSDVVRLAMRMA